MKKEFLSINEVAKLSNISRIAVYKKVKKGKIKAIRVGKQFVIPAKYVNGIKYGRLREGSKKIIRKAVKKAVRDYGQTLKLLGRNDD